MSQIAPNNKAVSNLSKVLNVKALQILSLYLFNSSLHHFSKAFVFTKFTHFHSLIILKKYENMKYENRRLY